MIRKANIRDLSSILEILKSVGHSEKNPLQGFLMHDYTKDEEKHRKKYVQDLATLRFAYVYENASKVAAFLIAYTIKEWLRETPQWPEDIYWKPGFNKDLINNSIIINQTAMYPSLTGQGIGSRLYSALILDLKNAGIANIFAETIIAPFPNLASLNFRIKQKYEQVGVRYENHDNTIYTTLVYFKPVS